MRISEEQLTGVLQQIKACADATNTAVLHSQSTFYQPLFDIDDTLRPGGYFGVGGIDKRKIRGEFYPCALEVIRMFLEACPGLPIILLTARPAGVASSIIPALIGALLPLAKEQIFVFHGELRTSLPAVLGAFYRHSVLYRAMAHTKFQRMLEYQEQLTKRHCWNVKLIFFGDSAQGDVLAAKKALRENAIHLAFIHRLTPAGLDLQLLKLIYFCDYKEVAANLAEKLGFANRCNKSDPDFEYAFSCRDIQGQNGGYKQDDFGELAALLFLLLALSILMRRKSQRTRR